jgi:hypothetical protein
MSKELAAIFAAMGTQDFEEVIRALQHTAAIVGVYRPKFKHTQKSFCWRMLRGRRPTSFKPLPDDISDERYSQSTFGRSSL